MGEIAGAALSAEGGEVDEKGLRWVTGGSISGRGPKKNSAVTP